MFIFVYLYRSYFSMKYCIPSKIYADKGGIE